MYTNRTHKVWIEVSQKAVAQNAATLRALVRPETKLLAVVKSNAYGHGLQLMSSLLERSAIDGFCVDSIIEGVRMREQGIQKPILVIGPTLPVLYDRAAAHQITLSIANTTELEELAAWQRAHAEKLSFHIKIDTGMHRRGFFAHELKAVCERIRQEKLALIGMYSHFAAAKDPANQEDTKKQFSIFETATKEVREAGFQNLTYHIAATSGTLLSPNYHLNAVRIGIGLYGVFPSQKLEEVYASHAQLTPALSLRTLVSEIKTIPAGERIGYDFTETLAVDTRIAILPIGYWHGIPRTLSSKGRVLINGKFCKILGIISMDMMAVDTTNCASCSVGDIATIIGKDGAEYIGARMHASDANTTAHELLTRLNPLIERVLTD